MRKGVLCWLWWLKGVANTCKLSRGCSQNGKLGRAAGCKLVLKKQKESCPIWMAMGVIVGLVAINVQQMDGTVHWQMQATINGWHRPLMQPPFLPINRHQESRTKRECECYKEQERQRSGCQGQQPCCLVQQCVRVGSWELSLSEVILLLHVCCNPFSIYL